MIELTTDNPLMAGLSTQLQPQPCSFVIFGGAGDLTRRKLSASLYTLALDGALPSNRSATAPAPPRLQARHR